MKYIFRVLVFPIVAMVFAVKCFFDGIKEAIMWYEVRSFRSEWERIHGNPYQGNATILPGETVKEWPKPTGTE